MPESETLLLVDAEIDPLSVTQIMLSRQGFNVIRANRAREALLLLADCPQVGVDLLMVELILPDMDGVELARQARRLRPKLPVLYVAGHTKWQSRPAPCIAKPYTAKRLAITVRDVLGSSHAAIMET